MKRKNHNNRTVEKQKQSMFVVGFEGNETPFEFWLSRKNREVACISNKNKDERDLASLYYLILGVLECLNVITTKNYNSNSNDDR